MTQTVYVDPTQGSNGSGTSGSPFSSLRNAFLGISAFDTASEDYIVNLLPGVDTDGIAGGAFTVASTGGVRNLIIQAVGSNKHTGVRSTGYRRTQPLSIIGGNSNVLVRLIGIAASAQIEFRGGTNLIGLVDDCLVYDSADFGFSNGGGNVTWRNCAAYQCTDQGFWSLNDSSVPTSKAVNCTSIANGTYGFEQWSGTLTLKNCYAGGNVADAYAGTMTRSNCMHSSSTSFSGSTANTAYSTANFVNVTSGSQNAKLVSGSALIGLGAGPSGDSDVLLADFEGTTRGGTTTDVGFDQFAASASGASLAMRRLAHLHDIGRTGVHLL